MLHYTNSCHLHLFEFTSYNYYTSVPYTVHKVHGTIVVINKDCMLAKYDEAYGRNFDDITLKLAKYKRTQFTSVYVMYALLFFYANKHKISCFISVSLPYTNIKYGDFIFKCVCCKAKEYETTKKKQQNIRRAVNIGRLRGLYNKNMRSGVSFRPPYMYET